MKKSIIKILSVIVAITCLASSTVPAFANCIWTRTTDKSYSEFIDENGQLKDGAKGEYFYCSVAKKVFPIELDTCPYCNETCENYTIEAEDIDGSKFHLIEKRFQNADMFSVRYAIYCPVCHLILSYAKDKQELIDKIQNPNNQNRMVVINGKPFCDGCYYECGTKTQITLDDIYILVNWDFESLGLTPDYNNQEDAHKVIKSLSIENIEATRNAVISERAADMEAFNQEKNKSHELKKELSLWEKIVEWFKNIFAVIAGLFS